MDSEKSLRRTLLALGLTTKEINFFLASFKLGPSSVNEVAKTAKLERSTAYLISQDLLENGFLQEDFKEYGKRVFAVEPKRLMAMLAAKQRVLRRQELEIEMQLPELQAVYQASEIRPKVKVFEGNSGLLSIWKDILSTRGEILVWTNQETESLIFTGNKHVNFIEERVKKGIKARVLAVNNLKGGELKRLDSQNNRITKLLPQGTDFTAETYIYDNKLAILDYKKDVIGVIIESEPIATSHKAIFEMNWKLL